MEKINDKKETNHIVEKYKSSAHSRSCHSIIFFIPWGSVSDDNEFEMVKSCFREFKNFCPVVVLTLVDDLEPNFRENPKGNYPKLLELRQSVAKKIGTPLHNIFCTINYNGESERNFEIERLAYRILHRAMLNCVEAAKGKGLRNTELQAY